MQQYAAGAIGLVMTVEERVLAAEDATAQAAGSHASSYSSAVPLLRQQLPQLPTECIAASNTLYRGPTVRCANLQWLWRLPPALPTRHWLSFAAAGESMYMALQQDVVGLDSTALDWLAYSDTAKLLAWAVAHEPLIELLQNVFGVDLALESIDANQQPRSIDDDLQLGFTVMRDDGGIVTSGQACFPRTWLAAVVARTTEQALEPTKGWERAWARLPYVIDCISLTSVELQALSIGSLVRLDNASLKGDRARVVIDAGATRLITDLNEMNLTVIEITQRPAVDANVYIKELENMTEHQQPEDVTQPPAADPGQTNGAAQPEQMSEPEFSTADGSESLVRVDAAAVPVVLRFEAGVVALPFAELSSIRPGYVFHLNKRLHDQLIAVYANNTQVAVGELVCVGDLVGVRITDMHVETVQSH